MKVYVLFIARLLGPERVRLRWAMRLIMKRTMVVAALIGLATLPLTSQSELGGDLREVRARDNSGAYSRGKVVRGSFNGISLDGLSVVAAVAGDKNLGIYELGGGRAISRSTVIVDERANAAQRIALVAMASELAKDVMGTIVNVTAAPIQFSDKAETISVATGQVALDVNKHMTHDPGCGAEQWFHPLSSVDDATLGLTEQNSFTGSGLGTKWSDPNKRSSFFGTFSY